MSACNFSFHFLSLVPSLITGQVSVSLILFILTGQWLGDKKERKRKKLLRKVWPAIGEAKELTFPHSVCRPAIQPSWRHLPCPSAAHKHKDQRMVKPSRSLWAAVYGQGLAVAYKLAHISRIREEEIGTYCGPIHGWLPVDFSFVIFS